MMRAFSRELNTVVFGSLLTLAVCLCVLGTVAVRISVLVLISLILLVVLHNNRIKI